MTKGEISDKRRSSRATFRVSVRALVYPPPGCETETVRACHLLTQDLSELGVSLIHAKPFQLGQCIDLDLPDGKQSAVVCRITPTSDGYYLAGCEFTDAPMA